MPLDNIAYALIVGLILSTLILWLMLATGANRMKEIEDHVNKIRGGQEGVYEAYKHTADASRNRVNRLEDRLEWLTDVVNKNRPIIVQAPVQPDPQTVDDGPIVKTRNLSEMVDA